MSLTPDFSLSINYINSLYYIMSPMPCNKTNSVSPPLSVPSTLALLANQANRRPVFTVYLNTGKSRVAYQIHTYRSKITTSNSDRFYGLICCSGAYCLNFNRTILMHYTCDGARH